MKSACREVGRVYSATIGAKLRVHRQGLGAWHIVQRQSIKDSTASCCGSSDCSSCVTLRRSFGEASNVRLSIVTFHTHIGVAVGQ
jgi:hypothetical protein